MDTLLCCELHHIPEGCRCIVTKCAPCKAEFVEAHKLRSNRQAAQRNVYQQYDSWTEAQTEQVEFDAVYRIWVYSMLSDDVPCVSDCQSIDEH